MVDSADETATAVEGIDDVGIRNRKKKKDPEEVIM